MSRHSKTSRRDFLGTSAATTTAAAAGLSLSRSAHATGKDVLKVALVGCGGRGTGAASQILQAHPSGSMALKARVNCGKIAVR